MEHMHIPLNCPVIQHRMEARRFRFMDLTIMHMDMMWQ